MNLSCDVIKDLLPLYHDEVCSEETKKIVEEHLKECPSCLETAQKLGMEFHVSTNELDETTFINNINQQLTAREIRRTVITLLVFLLLSIGIHYARTYKFISVPASSFDISEVSVLEDKSIGFFVEIKDEKNVSTIITSSPDENGIVYIFGKRSLTETLFTSAEPFGYHEEYFFYNMYRKYSPEKQEIYYDDTSSTKEIRFGTSSNYIVIWKDGMELPAASEFMENEAARSIHQ